MEASPTARLEPARTSASASAIFFIGYSLSLPLRGFFVGMRESGSTLANSLSFPAVFQKGRSPDCLMIRASPWGIPPLARLGGLGRLPAALCAN